MAIMEGPVQNAMGQMIAISLFWVDNRINELCIYTKMHNGINLMHEGVDVMDP